MAYSAGKHTTFSRRMQNFFNTFQSLRNEMASLDELYINEAASGGDAAWVDTPIATATEHTDGIVFMRALTDFCEGGVVATSDRRSNITAFVQSE